MSETNNWHALSIEESLKKLGSSKEGITNYEARLRQKKIGANSLKQIKRQSLWLIFFRQFASPVIYILIIAAIVTYFLKHSLDTYVILAVVFFNAIIGFIHEAKAEQAVTALAKLMNNQVKVWRGGRLYDLASFDLVPGDIIEIHEGMKAPADTRLIESENIRTDEAVLTGESSLQEKNCTRVAENAALGDRYDMLYSGTMIVSGHGLALVVATGRTTEFGQIAKEIAQTEETQTPLQKKLNIFSRKLLLLVIGIVIIILVFGIAKGIDWTQVFLTGLSVAIAIIPEGLPAIITITLAVGAFAMSRRKALVKKLLAVETLGDTTIICSDKTGTLTYNQMMVQNVFLWKEQQNFRFDGAGYAPSGKILPTPTKNLKDFLHFSLLCTNAEIFAEGDEWLVSGDSTEGALVTAAAKTEISKELIFEQFPRLDEIPFDTKRGWMAVLNEESKKEHIIVVKGKIEEILKRTDLKPSQKDIILTKADKLASDGLRIIAVAVKHVSNEITKLEEKDLTGLEFLGLAGMMDPPRMEAADAIELCRAAKIRPIMVTGDYGLTATAIAKKLGIIDSINSRVVLGQDMIKMNDKEFNEALKNVVVFARITPDQKLKIVEGFQALGEVVAMTGDGINDAPALKKADIGIAMGEGGTDTSREVADLILLDNNFATIVGAIEEGRTVFQNIKRAIFYLLATNFGEFLIIIGALILLPAPYNLPLIPVQILWLNLITDGTAGAALALEPTHKGILRHLPRERDIFNRYIFSQIALVSGIMFFVTMLLYLIEVRAGVSIERARTMAFATMVVLQILDIFNCRSLKQSVFSFSFWSNKYILTSIIFSFTLSFLTIQLSFLNQLFHMVPLNLIDWLKIFALSSLIIIIVELEKYFRRKYDVA